MLRTGFHPTSSLRRVRRLWMAAPSRRSITPFKVVRVVLGTVLLCAAAAKAHQFTTEPRVVQGILASAPFALGIAAVELGLALWLFSGFAQRAARGVLVAWFVAAFGAALGRQLVHSPSCGCFGLLAINPIFTLAFDAATLIALARFGPPAGASSTRKSARSRVIFAAVTWLVVAVTFLRFFGQTGPVELLANSEMVEPDGRLVVLEPDRWIGKRCPLFPFTDLGDALAVGRWEVILVHPDCPKCRQAMDNVSRAADSDSRYRGVGIALIAVTATPAHGLTLSSDVTARRDLEVGYLRPQHRWVVQTPASFWLDQGVVVPAESSDNTTEALGVPR